VFPGVLVQLLLIVPVSRFRLPKGSSGVSTNVPCDFPGEQIIMSSATRCFAAAEPAAAAVVRTTAATSAATHRLNVFIVSALA
jgi:hypothetical protein